MPSVDWEKLRTEYIAGGTTFRALAGKYGISKDAIGRRAKAENWVVNRDKVATRVRQETETKIVARTSDEYANIAVDAMRIRAKMLRRLEDKIDALPESIGTEMRQELVDTTEKGKRKVSVKQWKLRDLSAMFRDLTADMDLSDSSDVEDIDITRAEVYTDADA